MDMSGPMPDEAWFEIRDAEGELLETVDARIDGGSISAELPAFPKGTRGSIDLCTRYGDSVTRESEEPQELPDHAGVRIGVQIG